MNPEEVLKKLTEEMAGVVQAGAAALKIPPACFEDMQARFEDYVPRKSMRISLPVLARQSNPAGFMQGGYIAAAFDNCYGPFSYLVAKKPTASIDMNVQFIRPVKQGQRVDVIVRMVARGFTTLAMAGEMKDERGRLLATSQTNLVIFK